MAYALKYTTYKQHPNGDRITLKIYQKDWTGGNYGIGPLNGFALNVQGDQSALTAAIVKTSVGISLKDIFDRGTTQADGVTCVADGEKWGQWEEFYTNDPTKYRVDVEYTGGLTRNAVIWSGFLTPDSWGEEMNYGGDIKLTARDMLGYLDEQEFDLTGRVTIQSLIGTAITRSKAAMAVSYKTGECLYNTDGHSILAMTIGAETYSGGTWYQALEKCLESLGLVLRYDGNGGFFVTSLRYLASHTHETHTPQFTGRSGYRTLDPAVRKIIDTFNPKTSSHELADPNATDYVDTGTTMTQVITAHLAGGGEVTTTYHIPKYTLPRPAGEGYDGNLAVPAIGTPAEGAPVRTIYFPTDITTGEQTYMRLASMKAPFKVDISIDGALCEWTGAAPNTHITPVIDEQAHYIQKTIVHFQCKVGGVTYGLYNSGSWSTGSGSDIEILYGESYNVPACTNGTDYVMRVDKVVSYNTLPAEHDMLAPLTIEFSPVAANDLAGEYKTTTIYNESNHVEITRQPSIGSATSSLVSLSMCPNILGYGKDIAADAWRFSGDANTFPLAVMIHAQLLVYNGSENGNSIFTGNFNDASRPVAIGGTKYVYYQRNCVLLAGSYNFLTGDVDSATLREVLAWGDVWSTFDPDYEQKASKGQGGTSGSGGSSSGGVRGSRVEWGTATGNSQPLSVDGVSKSLLLADHEGDTSHLTSAQRTLLDLFEYDATNHTLGIKKVNDQAISFWTYGNVTAGNNGGGGGGGGATTLGGLNNVSSDADSTHSVAKLLVKEADASHWTLRDVSSIGTVKSAVMNGTTINPDTDGVLRLGTVITAHQSLAAYRTASAQDTIDNAINAKLGNCTSTNTAADKSFVNSSIATATATFRGTSASGLTEAQFLAWANGLTHDANDYVFWNTVDSNGNTLYKRYKYTGSAWAFEYTLNNSSFTSGQWSAINSGMTSSDKTKLNGIASGAQVNVLEGVKLNGTALTITGKSVNVLAATAITVPTGLSAGSLSNGTIAISFASGYSIPTNANQTAWSNKYSKPSSGIPLTDLAQTVQDIINLFEREGSGTTADPYVIKAKYSLYSPYNISAGGNEEGGGGGGSAVWGAITGTLSNQTDLYNALSGKIDKSVLSTKGSIIYASATDTPSALAIGTTGQILKVGGNGVPVWGDAPATGVTSIGGKTGAITLGSNLSINTSNVLSCTYSYTLPIATASTLGGVKVGTNLSINTNGVLSATDTTYESKAAASGGTAVSLVTTGEKYTWNAKQNALTAGSNITISGNTISAADTHDTNSAGTGIAVSGTRGSTIGISSTYQTYISHGESAYNSLGNYLPLSGGTISGTIWGGSLTNGSSCIGMTYGNNYGGIAIGSSYGILAGSIYSFCYPTTQGVKANGYYGGNAYVPMVLDFSSKGTLILHTKASAAYAANSVLTDWTNYTLYHSGNLTSSVIGGLGTLSNSISGTAANASKLDNTSKSAFVYATDGNTLGTYDAAENSVDNLARTMFFRQNTGSGKIGVHIVHSQSVNYALQIFSNSYARTGGLSYRIKENGTWGETNNIETTAHASATYLPLAGGTVTGALTINGSLWVARTDDGDVSFSEGTGIRRFRGSSTGWEGHHLPYDYASGYSFNEGNTTLQVAWKRDTSGVNYLSARTSENGVYGTWRTLYNSGNCNNTSTAWSASSLTLNGAITGATNITASGNVGIGTTSPTQKLQVNDGNIYIYQSSATNPAGLMLAQYFPSQGVWAGGIYADYYGNSICTTSGYTHGMFFVGGRANFDNFIFTNKDKTPLAKIDYNGNFVATGNVSAGSDLRWKEHITDFDDNGILKALSPVEWDWKEGHGKGHASGFIAQDIQKIMPYAVGGSEEGGYVLNYNCFHALWAKSLQNHETRVEYLERRVKELESKLKQLTS